MNFFKDIINEKSESTSNNLKQLIGSNNASRFNNIMTSLSARASGVTGETIGFGKIILHLIGQEMASLSDIERDLLAIKSEKDFDRLKQMYVMNLLFTSGKYSYGLSSSPNKNPPYFPIWTLQQVQVQDVLPLVSRLYTQSSKVLFTEAIDVKQQHAYKDVDNIAGSIEEIFTSIIYEMYRSQSFKAGSSTINTVDDLQKYIIRLLYKYFPTIRNSSDKIIKKGFVETNIIGTEYLCDFSQFVIIDDNFPEAIQDYLPRLNLIINYMPGQMQDFRNTYCNHNSITRKYTVKTTTNKINGMSTFRGSDQHLIQVPYLYFSQQSSVGHASIYEYFYNTEIFSNNESDEESLNISARSKFEMFVAYDSGSGESLVTDENDLLNLQTFFILFFKRISEGTINYKIL